MSFDFADINGYRLRYRLAGDDAAIELMAETTGASKGNRG